jgi:GDPmannose 4,6-dehydratase
MKTALIFGVDGQDGSYLAEFLLRRDYQVVGWAPESVPISLGNIRHLLDKITLVQGSLLDQPALIDLMDAHRPDEVYNLAAPSFPATSWHTPVEVGDIAALGAARLLEAVRLVNPKAHFYQASTSELFGNPAEVPQNERTPFRPRNPYGVAKLYAHWMTLNYRQHYNLYAVAGILFNHESPRRGLAFVTRKITHEAARIKLGLSDELHLGDLEARRDWGYAGDYIQAMWLMLQQETPAECVIGTGQTHSVREFCELTFACLGLDYHDYVVQDPTLMRPAEQAQLVADPTRARRVLGWEPTTSFEELVRLMVEADLKLLSSGHGLAGLPDTH